MFYLDSEVASLYRSLSCKNFSTFGFVASKMSRHSSCSNACNTSPKVPPSCMYISSIAFVRPSFGRTQVSTHCKEIKRSMSKMMKICFVLSFITISFMSYYFCVPLFGVHQPQEYVQHPSIVVKGMHTSD